MEKIYPLISSSAKGPLGACHLPRLWLKILLHATGRLPDGYRHGFGGFDERLVTNLGIDADAFVSFIETELPSYIECERWVVEHAKKLDPASIAAHNAMLIERIRPAESAETARAALGITDPKVAGTIAINDLEDWAGLHGQLTSEKGPSRA